MVDVTPPQEKPSLSRAAPKAATVSLEDYVEAAGLFKFNRTKDPNVTVAKDSIEFKAQDNSKTGTQSKAGETSGNGAKRSTATDGANRQPGEQPTTKRPDGQAKPTDRTGISKTQTKPKDLSESLHDCGAKFAGGMVALQNVLNEKTVNEKLPNDFVKNLNVQFEKLNTALKDSVQAINASAPDKRIPKVGEHIEVYGNYSKFLSETATKLEKLVQPDEGLAKLTTFKKSITEFNAAIGDAVHLQRLEDTFQSFIDKSKGLKNDGDTTAVKDFIEKAPNASEAIKQLNKRIQARYEIKAGEIKDSNQNLIIHDIAKNIDTHLSVKVAQKTPTGEQKPAEATAKTAKPDQSKKSADAAELPNNVFAVPRIPQIATKEYLEAKDEQGNLKNATLVSEIESKKTYKLKDGTTIVKTAADSGYVLASTKDKEGYQKMETFGPKAEDFMSAGVKQTDSGWSYKYENPAHYLAHINNDKKTGHIVSPIGKDGGFTVQHFGPNTAKDNYAEHYLADGTYIHEPPPPTALTKDDYDKILEIHSSAKPEFVQQAKKEIAKYFAQSSHEDLDRFITSGTKIILGQSMRALAADAKPGEASTFQKALAIENVNSTIGTAANPGTWANTEAAYNFGNKKIVLTQDYSRDVFNRTSNKYETVDIKSDRIGTILGEQIDHARGVQRINDQQISDRTQTAPSYPGETDYDRGVREWVNYYRGQHGLGPLQYDGAMAYAASIAASNQATMHGLSHDHYGAQPGWQTPVQRLASVGRASPYGYLENAYMGSCNAKYTVDMWMNSPGHRACILNRSASLIGVAYRTGQYGGYSTMSVGCVPAYYYYPQTQLARR